MLPRAIPYIQPQRSGTDHQYHLKHRFHDFVLFRPQSLLQRWILSSVPGETLLFVLVDVDGVKAMIKAWKNPSFSRIVLHVSGSIPKYFFETFPGHRYSPSSFFRSNEPLISLIIYALLDRKLELLGLRILRCHSERM